MTESLAQKHLSTLPWLAMLAVPVMLLWGWLSVNQMSYHDAQKEGAFQCQMVKVWYQSNHRHGWAPLNKWERRNCK